MARGDLLRAISRLESVAKQISLNEMADQFGFRIDEIKDDSSLALKNEGHEWGVSSDKLPPELQQEYFTDFAVWVCSACTALADTKQGGDLAEAGYSAAKQIRERLPIPLVASLIRQSELMLVWDDIFKRKTFGGKIDIPAVLAKIVSAKPIKKIDYVPRAVFTQEIVLLVDRRARLRPLWREQNAIASHLYQLVGEGFSVVVVKPDFLDVDDIPCDSQVIVVSDFDYLDPYADNSIRRYWDSWLRDLAGRGNDVVTIGAESEQPCSLIKHIGLFGKQPNKKHVDALVATMARCHLPETDRLRYLASKIKIPRSEQYGAELAVWNHQDCASPNQIQWGLSPRKRRSWFATFQSLPHGLKTPLDTALCRWRDSLHSDHHGIESVIDAKYGIGDGPSFDAFSALQSLEASEADREILDEWLYSVHDVLLDSAPLFSHREDMRHLFKMSQKHARENNLALPLALENPDRKHRKEISLLQEGQNLKPVISNSSVASVLQVKGPLIDRATRKQIFPGDVIDDESRYLGTPEFEYQLRKLYVPAWADSLWRDSGGQLYASHEQGVMFEYQQANQDRPKAGWRQAEGNWPWASNTGIDTHGLWAEFTLKNTTQRMRWIPAGEFTMGSDTKEPERDDDETQHHVSLTQGYWLADTACTQSLWKAVMGKNPSYFEGQDNPVESVSWNDVKEFTDRLNESLPGLDARMPTEAEWEYAARAGTVSAFWWGNELTPERANYNGASPYNDGEQGEVRGGTVKVKQFKPNPWGLYQVHGNVWEWCLDWFGSYENEKVTNPTGREKGEGRVCRGGSWINNGRNLRSAYRNHNDPDNRNNNIGFRLAAAQQGRSPVDQLSFLSGWLHLRRIQGAYRVSISIAKKVRDGPAPGSHWRHAPPLMFPTAWASSFGQDPFGLWCGFEVAGIEQRMRWIPKGEFLMGSPEGEDEMQSEETLHTVTLTEGYWLADTACTQALWETLMGVNKSRFKGAENPVERVSWKEVRKFIERLNDKVSGLSARLPTEAEWEYAARAGTRTAFWWGDDLTPAQANYNGNYPYAKGMKGEYREKTVNVKEFEANPWGLYQVHGNVWEWCEDWYRSYGTESVVDPPGPENGEARVCRGGCWLYDGRLLRSACRGHYVPGSRHSGIGFRLAAGQQGDAEHPSRSA